MSRHDAGRERRALRARRRADRRHLAHPHTPWQPRLGKAAGPGGDAAVQPDDPRRAGVALRRRVPDQAAARAARPARADGSQRPADLGRGRPQAVDLAPLAGARAEHRADLERGGGDGLRAAGGRGGEDGAAEGPAGGHDLRGRRVPDERAGAGDGQAAGTGDREYRLVGQRVRGDRGASAAQVRSPGGHQVHEPGSRDAGGELRDRGDARDVRRRADADTEACARAGYSIGCGDPDRLPREQEVFNESGRPGEGRRGGLNVAMTETIQKLYVDGEWYETGEAKDVTSPYDGSVVGRVAFGGGGDATRAIDAAERAMQSPLPAHARASVLDGVAAL